MLLEQDSKPALISLMGSRRRGRHPLPSYPHTQPRASRPRYAITVDNRLARVEDSIQRLMPVAQAFENWLQTSDQKLPWVDRPPPYSGVLTRPVIPLFRFRASPETDNGSSSTHPPIPDPAPGPGPPQQPSAPTIHSYLLPHSQGVHQPSSSGGLYVPSKSVQKLTQYPSGGVPGSTEMNGMGGGSISQLSSPVMEKLLDDDIDGTNERWSDRFSFVAKDSYGNLRYTFPSSVLSERCR